MLWSLASPVKGMDNGDNLGGLEGVDAHCQQLATEAGAGHELSGVGNGRANAVLGVDVVRWSGIVRGEGAVDCDLSGHCDQSGGVWVQPVWGFVAGCARSALAQSVLNAFLLILQRDFNMLS